MGKSTMNRTQQRRLRVVILAYAHRYLFPLLIILIPIAIGKYTLLYMGIGCILLAIHDFVGYKLRWKHIFCSYQNAYHQKMTPEHTNWNFIKKSDAYGIPLFFGGLGLIIIIRHFLNL